MALVDIVKQAQSFTVKNSPLILTALGSTGVVATGVMAYRAGWRVGRDVNAGHYEPLLEGKEPEVYDTKALIQTYWPEFVAPALLGAGSIACIIGANRIGTRRAAALAVAYGLSEKAFTEYKEKVYEKLGEKKEHAIRDSIAQDQVNRNPVSMQQTNEVIITDNGDVLCYESHVGRYFKSTMEGIRKAENEINKRILDEGYCSLSDFYDKIGLSATEYSEQVGWDYDNMLEIVYSTVLSEDGKPCISVGYRRNPTTKYFRHSR